MTDIEIREALAAIAEPLRWDCRGDEEEYEYMDKANEALEKICNHFGIDITTLYNDEEF